MSQNWEVVGGGDKGGILVRTGKELSSPQEGDRLSTGALVKELEKIGERLNYELLVGTGPKVGWVSVKLKDKDLLVMTDTKGPEEVEAAGEEAEEAAEEASAVAAADESGEVAIDESLKGRIETAARASGAEEFPLWCFKYKVMGFPHPAAKFRIICFHNAGSAESIWTTPPKNDLVMWCKESKTVELVAMSYPGRDKLLKTKPHETIENLIMAMLPMLFEKVADGVPFAFWSHSVGTWVAFELLQLMRKVGLPMPQIGFFNAFPCPQMPEAKRPWKVNRRLSDKQMQAEAASWDGDHFGGPGKMVFDEPEWTKTWCPLMRADFRLFDEYKYQHAAAPKFTFPIHSYFMEKERLTKPEMLQGWAEQTTGEFTFDTLPDMGHLTCFYVPPNKKAYFAKVLDVLKEVAPT